MNDNLLFLNLNNMNKQVKMDMACKKCWVIQKRDESMSNDNWNYYDNNQKCECGEKFSMRIDWEFL